MRSRPASAAFERSVCCITPLAPILLWTSSSAGHGFGTPFDERISGVADVYAFLFDQLGVAYRPVRKPVVP